MPIRTFFPLTRRPLTRLAALALPIGLTLGGCVSFGAKAPPQLLTVASTAAVGDGSTLKRDSLSGIFVTLPDAPRKLATTRVPVQVNDTSVAYVKDAQWTDAPRDLFHRLLTDSLSAEGKFVISEGYGPKPRRLLSGVLLDFGLDAQTKEAVVTYDATLTDTEKGESIRRRFTARTPVREIKADRIAEPINQAANQVASDIAKWVKGN